jgi:Uma2 family endonuclease
MATETTVEIEYPCSDGQPMAETEIHVLSIFSTYEQLRSYFAARKDVFVAADMFWYWKKGDTDLRIAPDIMIVPGVPNEPPRRSFFSWEEGAIPSIVIEFASKGTWRDDLGNKYDQYEKLGVREYYLFDPEGLYLVPVLQGHRLRGKHYRRMYSSDDVFPTELGFSLKAEGDILRVIDTATNERVLTGEERATVANQLFEQEKQRAEQEKQRAEQEKQRAEQEKQRADTLQVELERLNAVLKQLGQTSGNGS